MLIAVDEGERLLFVYRTWCNNCSVCHAISRFRRHLGPAWHILSRSHVFSFFTRELVSILWHSFTDENFHSKIIRYVDIMLTMRSAHCICFYGFKQDQLRSTIFDSFTNYIFSLLKAIYNVVFALVSHHFWKIHKRLNSETSTFSSH